MKLLLATNNRGKLARYQRLLKDCQIYTPNDLGIEKVEVIEDGSLQENAIKKAKAYLGKTDLPILANDTGFYVEGEGLIEAPKRLAIGSEDLSEEEIYKKIISFWQNIAKKYGGEVDAYWVDVFALVKPDGSVKTAEAHREVLLTDKVFGQSHINFPMRSLYICKDTNKPAVEHTEEEERQELEPIMKALIDILC